MPKTRVFVLDDHQLIREAIGHFLSLENDLELVGEASTVAEGLAGIERTVPDVALLDVRLPDGDGIQVCREIRSRHPDTACLILTGAEEDSTIDAVLAGAAGYVTKGVGFEEVVSLIRRAASGEHLLEQPSAEALVARLRGRTHSEISLTAQEGRILELVGRGLTNRQIGKELHLAEQTVKNYVSSLLSKLGFERRTQAAVYAAKRRRADGDG